MNSNSQDVLSDLKIPIILLQFVIKIFIVRLPLALSLSSFQQSPCALEIFRRVNAD